MATSHLGSVGDVGSTRGVRADGLPVDLDGDWGEAMHTQVHALHGAVNFLTVRVHVDLPREGLVN